MRIVIAGGSGLLGGALCTRLVADGHDVVVLSRTGDRRQTSRGGARFVAWTPDGTAGPWAQEIDGADAIVNLSGAGIADKRWSPERKALLRSSRLLSTASLVAALQTVSTRPPTFVQGTAMGYYGASLDDRPRDESAPAGEDFLGRLCVEWETAAAPVTALGCRLIVVRTGLVLDPSGGALPPLALPFRLFGGGPMATGRQMMSWIHRDDWTAMVAWLLASPAASGVYNATAPHPVSNREFAKALGRALRRPSWFPIPAFVLRLVVGEMADPMLILGQSVVPTRALAQGFVFAHPALDEALAHALGRR